MKKLAPNAWIKNDENSPALLRKPPTPSSTSVLGDRRNRTPTAASRKLDMKTSDAQQPAQGSPAGSIMSEKSNFTTGKTFWMNLMNGDASSESTSVGGNTATPIGRQIQPTFTNGSPLSEASTYNASSRPGSTRSKKSSPMGNYGSSTKGSGKKVMIVKVPRDVASPTSDRQPAISPSGISQSRSGLTSPTGIVPKRPSISTIQFPSQQQNHTVTSPLPMELPSPQRQEAASTPTLLARHSCKLEKIGLNKNDQSKFQGAYDAWSSCGLKKDAVNRSCQIDSRCETSFQSTLAHHQAGKPVLRSTLTRPQTDELVLKVAPAIQENSATEPKEEEKSNPVVSGFKSLLNRWNTGKVVVPADDSKLQRSDACKIQIKTAEKINDEQHAEAVVPQVAAADVAPEKPLVVETGIRKFNKDYFDVVREKGLSPKPDTAPSVPETKKIESEGASAGDSGFSGVCRVYGEEKVENLVRDHEVDDDNKSRCSSRALVIVQDDDNIKVVIGDTSSGGSKELVVHNIQPVTSDEEETRLTQYVPCQCSKSLFSGNDDLVSFFLPKMGTACMCGKQINGIEKPADPTALENILRPWQVDFLRSFGIFRGEELVKARHRSGEILAKSLRQWRKKKGMTSFKTSSCGMALHIWAKTCKVHVRSVRKQQLENGDRSFELQGYHGDLMNEMTNFLADLPAAPTRHQITRSTTDDGSIAIQVESQMEV